jgi:hypothetical protein
MGKMILPFIDSDLLDVPFKAALTVLYLHIVSLIIQY